MVDDSEKFGKQLQAQTDAGRNTKVYVSLISLYITIVIFIQLLSLMVHSSVQNSLQFYSWRFYCNTSFAPVSFTYNKLLKKILNKNGLLYC